MPKLKRQSGSEVVAIFQHFGFSIVTRRGSHIKLQRVGQDGGKQTLTVPIHRQLDTGTCHSIFRQACKYISANELQPYFYSK